MPTRRIFLSSLLAPLGAATATELIDRMVAATRRAGALGAKVCGAGGGGCVFFFVEPDAKARVEAAIARLGAEVLPVTVAPAGVQVKVLR